MKIRNSAFVYSEDCLKYNFSKTHVFRPERAYDVFHFLKEENLFGDNLNLIEPEPASREELFLFHTKSYIEAIEQEDEILLNEHGVGFGDNPFFKGISSAVKIVAGATITAAIALTKGYDIAFSFAGGLHHAHPDYAYGFCLVNDAALAIKKLILEGYSSPGSIMYIDIDAHFGDGVVYGLYERPEVITFSLHESGRYLFPGTGFLHETGKGEGKGLKINVPLPPYSAEREFLQVTREIIVPLIEKTKPMFIVLQSGTDGYNEDPLTHLKYSPHCYSYFFKTLKKLQDKLGFKLLILGGGGYVPWFASLIWLAATMNFAFDTEFEEVLRLLKKQKNIIKVSEKIEFEPDGSKLDKYYAKEFNTTLENAINLVEKVPRILEAIR